MHLLVGFYRWLIISIIFSMVLSWWSMVCIEYLHIEYIRYILIIYICMHLVDGLYSLLSKYIGWVATRQLLRLIKYNTQINKQPQTRNCSRGYILMISEKRGLGRYPTIYFDIEKIAFWKVQKTLGSYPTLFKISLKNRCFSNPSFFMTPYISAETRLITCFEMKISKFRNFGNRNVGRD